MTAPPTRRDTVSKVYRDLQDTQTMVIDIHRYILKDQERADSQPQPVSHSHSVSRRMHTYCHLDSTQASNLDY